MIRALTDSELHAVAGGLTASLNAIGAQSAGIALGGSVTIGNSIGLTVTSSTFAFGASGASLAALIPPEVASIVIG